MFEEHFNSRVGDNGFTVRGVKKIVDVLRDDGNAEIVFTGTFNKTLKDFGRVFVTHEIPSLVNDEESFFKIFSDLSPDVVEDDEHDDRADFITQFSESKDGNRSININIGLLVKDTFKRTHDVSFKTGRKVFRSLVFHTNEGFV